MGLPGAVIFPHHYGEAMVLYSAVNRVEVVVDGAPPGPRGRLFIIEPEKPTKVPYEAGRFILEHMVYHGVVRVDEAEKEDGTGIVYDVPKASQESLALTEDQDGKIFAQYVSDVVTDYLNQKKPAPKTPERIQRIINRRGFDLKKYGIFPLGEKESEQLEKVKTLEAENKAKDDAILKMQAQLDQLTKLVGAQLQGSGDKEEKRGRKANATPPSL